MFFGGDGFPGGMPGGMGGMRGRRADVDNTTLYEVNLPNRRPTR